MTAGVLDRSTTGAPSGRVRLLGGLDRRSQTFEHLTPNWFASVMGTGIVANAAATLPIHLPGLRVTAVVVWALASIVLVALTTAFVCHWVLHRDTARAYLQHPVMSLFYGAPPMALLTVGAGTLLLGKDILGDTAALWIDIVLWTSGTVMGIVTCVLSPLRLGAHRGGPDVPLPAWLMPVVPPMVSATTGALLLPHIADARFRVLFLVGCYGLFALSSVLGSITMAMICRRLLVGGPLPVQATPTVWITLGVVGQSVTAANMLGTDSAAVFVGNHAPIADALRVFGILFGLAVGTFGVVVFTAAIALTVRAFRCGLTFSLTWWSFTFPVGTCVTGATVLGTSLHSDALHVVALSLYVLLAAAWLVVASRTAHASFVGRIFLP